MSKKARVIKQLIAEEALELYKEGMDLPTLIDRVSGREWQLFLELLSGWFMSCAN